MPGSPQSSNVILNAFDAKTAKYYEQLSLSVAVLETWNAAKLCWCDCPSQHRRFRQFPNMKSITLRLTATIALPKLQNRSDGLFWEAKKFPNGSYYWVGQIYLVDFRKGSAYMPKHSYKLSQSDLRSVRKFWWLSNELHYLISYIAANVLEF